MLNEQLYNTLVEKLHNRCVFWSYDVTLNRIPDDILIEKVLLHLDIDETLSLFTLYPKKQIKRVWKENILSQEPMYHGINRLYCWFLFGIKDPDRYIRENRNKHYKSLMCKD
jgi:nitrogen-specific signal transduction histidine kinase